MPQSPPSETTADDWNTDADIDRLRLLYRVLAQGHSIGRLAPLTNEELHHLAGEPAVRAAPSSGQIRQTVDAAALVAALQSYDASAIDQEMARLGAVLSPLALLRDALMPTLARVGDDRYRHRATIAQEHLMSSAVRQFLVRFSACTPAARLQPGCCLPPCRAIGTRLAPLVPRCSPQRAASPSPTSVRICRRPRSSEA